MRVKANFPPASSTAGEKRTFLFEHLSVRTAHNRPTCVTSLTVFCDESHFSGPTDSAGLVSLEIQGYVQNQDAVSLTKMKNWIDLASWKPVPGGLVSDCDFKANMRRFQDPSDPWTRLTVFGRVGANNAGRIVRRNAEGQARKVNENYHIMTFQIVSSNGLRHVILSLQFLSVFNDRLHTHRRRARQSGLKSVPQSGEQWQIPPISRLLLPSVLLLPIRPRAGAVSRAGGTPGWLLNLCSGTWSR